MLLIIKANAGGAAQGVVLAQTPPITTISVLDGVDLGAYDPELVLAVRQDGVATAVQTHLQSRQLVFPLRVRDASKDALVATVSSILAELEAVNRSGGVLTYQSASSSYPVYFDLRAGKAAFGVIGKDFETNVRLDGTVTLFADPLARGLPMGYFDGLTSSITSGGATVDQGAGTVDTPGSGVMTFSTTAQKRVRWAARGYTYSQVQLQVKVTPGSTVVAGNWGLYLAKTDGTDNGIMVRVLQGTGLQVCTVAAGASTQKALAAWTPSAFTPFWLRMRISGVRVTAEVFTSEPAGADTPAATCFYDLTSSDILAGLVPGHPGLRVSPASTGDTMDDFVVAPNTHQVNVPGVVQLDAIPGDAPALLDIDTHQPAGTATQRPFGLVAVAEEAAENANLVWNGSFERDTAGSNASGWGTSTFGVGTATSWAVRASVLGNAAASRGTQSMEVVTAGSVANEGVRIVVYGRFRAGRSYSATAKVWVSTGTPSLQLQVYPLPSGSGAASANVTASTTPQQVTVTFTPTADAGAVAVCLRTNGTIATTFRVDEVALYDLTALGLLGGFPGGPVADDGATISLPLDVADAANAWATDGTITSDANARSGYSVRWAAVTTGYIRNIVDPGLVKPPSLSGGEQRYEVWARVGAAIAAGGTITFRLAAWGDYSGAPTRYDLENGSNGLVMTAETAAAPSGFRRVRLGVVSLPTTSAGGRRLRWAVQVSWASAAAAAVWADWLEVIPVGQRASGPTGLAAAGYPAWFAGTGAQSRRVGADGVSYGGASPYALGVSGGVIGAPLVVPAGNARVLLDAAVEIPNQPGSVANTAAGTFTVSANPTPRFLFVR